MSKHTVSIDINGTTVTKEVDSRMLLVHFIREELQMTGTHIGCDTSSCGACTILINGEQRYACLTGRISRGAWSAVRVLYPGNDHESSGTAGEKSKSQ